MSKLRGVLKQVLLCATMFAATAMFGSLPSARAAQSTGQQSAGQQSIGPAAGQNTQAAPPASAISAEEMQAINAIKSSTDPATQISLCNDFAKRFPTSPRLASVYLVESQAYASQQDIADAGEFAEKSAQLDPHKLWALILSAAFLPEPETLHGTAAAKEQRLSEAETSANAALKLIPATTKRPNESDQAFQYRKTVLTKSMHSALGMVYLDRANLSPTKPDTSDLARAEQEYKIAISTLAQPRPNDYFELGEVYEAQGNRSAAIRAYKNAAQAADPSSSLKTLALQKIQALKGH